MQSDKITVQFSGNVFVALEQLKPRHEKNCSMQMTRNCPPVKV